MGAGSNAGLSMWMKEVGDGIDIPAYTPPLDTGRCCSSCQVEGARRGQKSVISVGLNFWFSGLDYESYNMTVG